MSTVKTSFVDRLLRKWQIRRRWKKCESRDLARDRRTGSQMGVVKFSSPPAAHFYCNFWDLIGVQVDLYERPYHSFIHGLGVNGFVSTSIYSTWQRHLRASWTRQPFIFIAWRILGRQKLSHDCDDSTLGWRVTASALVFATKIPHIQFGCPRGLGLDEG
jgi:hypothetical protein